MKKLIAIWLCLALVLCACNKTENIDESQNVTPTVTVTPTVVPTTGAEGDGESDLEHIGDGEGEMPEFEGLDDPALQTYIEDAVYTELVAELNSENYFVENVDTVYLSKEYLEEIAYNSQENIYFGYTLSELDAAFEGTRYVFTLGDDGQTTVTAFEAYDDTYDRVLKNVAIGTGVILVCVTVSVVTAGTGATAISLIFATSAKTGATMAVSSGVISGVTAGVVTGIQTGDFDEAIKAGAMAGSESFKWGAISGAVIGGTSEAISLKGATLNGLTMNEAALIQKESGYPLSIIKQFHNMDEYLVYKNAGLKSQMVGGELALVKNIDLDYLSNLNGTQVTNLERMQLGYAPLDPVTGKAYQLHHIGQKSDATLAILTEAEHQGNASILNVIGKESEIDRAAFNKIRKQFWIDFSSMFT